MAREGQGYPCYQRDMMMMMMMIYRLIERDRDRGRDRDKDSSRGIVAKMLDCGIVLSEFELQSRYYVKFRINIIGKCMNFLVLQ